jgi:hypothetical protein
VRTLLEELSELEAMGFTVSRRTLVATGMVFSGATVAGATAIGQLALCATTGPLCALAPPATIPTIAAGPGMVGEGLRAYRELLRSVIHGG